MNLTLITKELGFGFYDYNRYGDYTYIRFYSFNTYDINIQGDDLKFYVDRNYTHFFKTTEKKCKKYFFGLIKHFYNEPVILFKTEFNILYTTNDMNYIKKTIKYDYNKYLKKLKHSEEIKNNIFILN